LKAEASLGEGFGREYLGTQATKGLGHRFQSGGTPVHQLQSMARVGVGQRTVTPFGGVLNPLANLASRSHSGHVVEGLNLDPQLPVPPCEVSRRQALFGSTPQITGTGRHPRPRSGDRRVVERKPHRRGFDGSEGLARSA
jgi:hypothetical protein